MWHNHCLQCKNGGMLLMFVTWGQPKTLRLWLQANFHWECTYKILGGIHLSRFSVLVVFSKLFNCFALKMLKQNNWEVLVLDCKKGLYRMFTKRRIVIHSAAAVALNVWQLYVLQTIKKYHFYDLEPYFL